MNPELNTNADIKLFGNRATICKNFSSLRQLTGGDIGEQYVYQIKNNDTVYILKGYKICLEHLKPGDDKTKEGFDKNFRKFMEIFEEYYFYKIISVFNIHFAKPLILDYEIKLALDEYSLSYLCLEIIFECGGDPLSELQGTSINLVYNFMRQSASALDLLHNIEGMNFSLTPENLLYDRDMCILKLFPLISEQSQIPFDYAAPELQRLPSIFGSKKSEFDPLSANVYSWAMCFYALVSNKGECELSNEAKYYKQSTEELYNRFLNSMQIAFKGIKTEQVIEQKKLAVICEQLTKSLSFKPESRPKIRDVIINMRKFEADNRIPFSRINCSVRCGIYSGGI